MSKTIDYRTRIYKNYATNFQDALETSDEVAAFRLERLYRHYLRQRFPGDKNVKIADLACGGGNLLCFFKRMGYTIITGVDISPEQVGLARASHAHSG